MSEVESRIADYANFDEFFADVQAVIDNVRQLYAVSFVDRLILIDLLFFRKTRANCHNSANMRNSLLVWNRKIENNCQGLIAGRLLFWASPSTVNLCSQHSYDTVSFLHFIVTLYFNSVLPPYLLVCNCTCIQQWTSTWYNYVWKIVFSVWRQSIIDLIDVL